MTNGSIDDHEKELREVLKKLQNAGYRASEKKTELFKKELTWLGYFINQNGVKPIRDKTEAMTKLAAPKNAEELKSFLGSIQHLSKFINNLSKKTDRMRRLLKKDVKWEWTAEIDDDFEQLKKEITEAPCLAHFDPKRDNYITTDACNTGLGATLWQKEGIVFRPIAFASRFLTDCERKYAINELEFLGALWGLEHFRYYVYGKRVNLLTDHQALQPLLKKNREHKQYSARLTRWLDRLSHFDVKIQYTAGKNIPLTDYLSRHPIVPTEIAELENKADGQNEAEADEEFVVNQKYGLFEFNRERGSIKRFTEQLNARGNSDQSQRDKISCEQNSNTHLLKTSPPPVNIINRESSNSKMDKVNGIDMNFIFKKRGHSPETKRLWIERNHLLKPDRTRIVGKGKESERIQEYRPNQASRKRIAEINIKIYNRFFRYCETLETTPLLEYQQNNNESWLQKNQSDGESETSHIKRDKCPTNALKKFKKHETVNLIRLKQTAIKNTLSSDQKQGTEEAIKRAEKDFALDIPLLVDETARDIKMLNAIAAIENQQPDSIFYPYRPHRSHLSTRFGLLFYNDRIVIPENMQTTVIAMLHHGHMSAGKMEKLAEAFWWPGMNREIHEKAESCPSCRAAGKNLVTQNPFTEKNNLDILTEPNQEIQLDFAGPIKSKTRGDVYILVAIDRFSKWPTAHICKSADTRTVKKFLTNYFTDNGIPRVIRTDNGSCFKSIEFKQFCKDQNIKRIRCTPNLHTGTGLVERAIRSIKSLTRANMADGSTFEDSVQLAIRTIRQTPHSKLKMTPFQMHLDRKPRTALINLIDKPECLLSNWKRTLTNYVLAQPTELQVVTINDAGGELADYLVLNESKKKGRSVSRDFKNYQFFEKENKPNSMKCGFKTNKVLTAVAETGHTVTTSEGRVIHKKLASKPLKFQTPRKPEEQRPPTNRCRRCGKFSSGEWCETHLRLEAARQDSNNNEPSTSHTTIPTMPSKKRPYSRVVLYDSSSNDSGPTNNQADTTTSEEEDTDDITLKDMIGREVERIRLETPMPSSPIGCSTELIPPEDTTQPDTSGTPIRNQSTSGIETAPHDVTGKIRLKQNANGENNPLDLTIEPCRSERIKTAKRTVKLGGVEYF